jgi:hypothetical protein
MTRYSWFVGIVACLAAVIVVPCHAQTILLLPVGARNYGMGEGGVADASDAANAFFNPAILAVARGATLSSAYAEPYGSTSLFNIGLSAKTRPLELGKEATFTFGGGVRFSQFERGILSDIKEDYFALAVAAAINVGEHITFAVGGTLKRVTVDDSGFFSPLVVTSFHGNVFDVGAMVQGSGGDEWRVTPALGASMVNRGEDLEAEVSGLTLVSRIPRLVRIGASVRVEGPPVKNLPDFLRSDTPALSIQLLGEHMDVRDAEGSLAHGGVELGFLGVLFGRGGVIKPSTGDAQLVFGAGLQVPAERVHFRVDYAVLDPDFGKTRTRVGGTLSMLY